MEATLETFQNQHADALSVLEKLCCFLKQGIQLGIPIDTSLLTKLKHAREHVAADRLKVALIGGFSEGKTSIAVAWMERFDASDMKISEQESSNDVKVYEVDGNFVLIDTPGLFGFKEKYNADSHTIEKYKDITRKYVSEAHLVLYVMNSTNPIKESHKSELKWLFRTLGLLARTIFVLSRFDEVADVEDEEDYSENLQIKRDNVRKRLREAIGASDEEIAGLTIVAVAANPFDMGTEYWLERQGQFKTLSHIGKLKRATAAKIERSGGVASIVEQSQRSVILDVLDKELPVAKENDRCLAEEVERLKKVKVVLDQQMSDVEAQISDARINLREFVVEYFSGLCIQVAGVTVDTFDEFYQHEIGRDGINISARLQSEFERQLSSVTQELNRMRLSFDSEISHFNDTITKLGKQGISFIISGNFINSANILAARDGIVHVAGRLGVDISKIMKFKPWGAVNLAKSLNGILAVAGLALEAWDSYERIKQQKAVAAAKKGLTEGFELQRKGLLDFVDGDEFISSMFPEYALLREDVETVTATIASQQEVHRKFKEWLEQGQIIEAEFSKINS